MPRLALILLSVMTPAFMAAAPARPERTTDMIHVGADLALNIEEGKVAGRALLTMRPLKPDLKSVVLDCGPNLKVSGIKRSVGPRLLSLADRDPKGPAANGDIKATKCEFTHEDKLLTVQLDPPAKAEDIFTLEIAYEGVPPRKGLFFIKPNAENPDRPVCVWSQGQAEDTHLWLPCYDFPDDRARTETLITVPKPMKVLSNGDLVGVRDHADGTSTYHWRTSFEHSSYLITIAASDFAVYQDRALDGKLPLTYYASKRVPEETVRRVLGRTPEMIDFFSKTLGAPYPYSKYAQVCVPEFTMLGMENTSATTLADSILNDPIEFLESDSDDLVSHELSHQWFGDLLTCETWGHAWLNEGFATYAEALWAEHVHGFDGLILTMEEKQSGALGFERFRKRPMVSETYRRPDEVFDPIIYDRGGSVLHMLRGVVGDSAWWDGLRRYIRQRPYSLVQTVDLQTAMQDASGQDLSWFFDQWTQWSGSPSLKITTHHDDASGMLEITVVQQQVKDDADKDKEKEKDKDKAKEKAKVYRLPVDIVIWDNVREGRKMRIVVDQREQTFRIPVKKEPVLVEWDPEGWVLASVEYAQSPEALRFQLDRSSSVLARLEAARQLGKIRRGPDRASALLAKAALRERNDDARAEMIGALDARVKDERASCLIAAKDGSPRVRVRAFQALARGEWDQPWEELCRAAWGDSQETYNTRRIALDALVKAKVKDSDALLRQALDVRTARERIALIALTELLRGRTEAVRKLAIAQSAPDRPRPLRRVAVTRLADFVKDHEDVQNTLIALIADPDRSIRQSVWSILASNRVASALSKLQDRLRSEDPALKPALQKAVDALSKPDEKPKS